MSRRIMRTVISKDMIGSPRGDLIHTLHVGITGDTFGDLSHLGNAMDALNGSAAPPKKGRALMFGRKNKHKSNSQRTSTGSDEANSSIWPEQEPYVDFGPSFFEEVMQAMEERLQQSSLKSKYSDFVSSNECDFSDSDTSLQKDDDFSETSGSLSLVEGSDEAMRRQSEDITPAATIHENPVGSGKSSSSVTDSDQSNAVDKEKKQDSCPMTDNVRKESVGKWSRACRLPVNGLLLRTLGASVPGTVVNHGNNTMRCQISGPVQLISDSRLVKGRTLPIKSEATAGNHDRPAPPLPDLASLGAKLTSAESVNATEVVRKSSDHWKAAAAK